MPTGGSTNKKGSAASTQARFGKVLRHLVRRNNHQGIVRLVERWEEEGDLTLDARLAEARAFIYFKLMDRAWVRLREVSEENPNDIDCQLLTAQMFIERGWPTRARKVVARLEELDPKNRSLAALREAGKAPPLEPPANAREIERSGSPGQLLELAERFLAVGSFIRARALLDRLHHADPNNDIVAEYLWALRAEYVDGGQSVDQLLEELWPSRGEWLEKTEQLAIHDVQDLLGPEPPTAELERTHLGGSLPLDRPDAGFPHLFRFDEEAPTASVEAPTEEVTRVSRLASTDELGEPREPTETTGGRRDDTQFLQVIQDAPVGLVPTAGPVHTRAEETDSLRLDLDLHAYRQRMGMSSDLYDDATDAGLLESEDDDLVVMTRREALPGDSPTPPEGVASPVMEVIEKVPEPPAEARRPPPESPTAPARPRRPADPPSGTHRRKPTPPRGAAGSWLRLVAGLGAMAVGVTLLGLVTLWAMHRVASGRIRTETQEVLAQGDYRALLDLETRLVVQIDAGSSPVAVRQACLSLVEAVLWSEYLGDPAARAKADEALAAASSGVPEATEVIHARVVIALADGQLGLARELVEGSQLSTTSDRYLAARVALAEGRVDDAAAIWSTVTEPGGVRYSLLGPEILKASGAETEALDGGINLALKAPDNPLVVLAAQEGGWDSAAPAERLAAIDDFLARNEGTLAPRHEARLQLVRASMMSDAVESRRALLRARVLDPNSVGVFRAFGDNALVSNNVLEAVEAFGRCLEIRSTETACRRGIVQALLDLDRVERATDVVAGWGQPELRQWVDSKAGRAVSDVEGDSPLASLAMGLSGTSDAARHHLRTAAVVLGASTDPLDQLLGQRAAARLLLVGEEVVSPDLLEGSPDPEVQTLLGLYHAEQGRRSLASEHLERAAELGPECATAHFERGRYFATLGDDRRASQAFRRYLDLGPQGVRLEEATNWLDGH